MGVARTAAFVAHNHTDVINLLPWLGLKLGERSLWYTNSAPDHHVIYPGGQRTLALCTKCVTPVALTTAPRAQLLKKGAWFLHPNW